MSTPLAGPGDRYKVAVEVLSSTGSDQVARSWVTEGEPVWDTSGQGAGFRVVAPDACSLLLNLGENGLTLSNIRLINANWAVATAKVSAGPGAPDWLPDESSYLLFQGDRSAAQSQKERYIPLEGMVAERSWPQANATPLDALAVAVGRSVARANAALARVQADAGVALVSTVTIRVAVQETDVAGGRVLVTLGSPAQEEGGTAPAPTQFVELTMTTVPGAPASGAPAAATGGTTMTTQGMQQAGFNVTSGTTMAAGTADPGPVTRSATFQPSARKSGGQT